MTEPLFPGYAELAEPEPAPSAHDRRRAALERRRARVAESIRRGYHPLGLAVTGGTIGGHTLVLLGPDRDGDGHTCGDCAHRVLHRLGGTYPKCDRGPMTGGPATDVLARWPACYRWEAKP